MEKRSYSPDNDNEATRCFDSFIVESRHWLSQPDRLGPLEWTQPALEKTLATILPLAVAGDPFFFPEDWLQCLMHLETLLQPMPDEHLLQLQCGTSETTKILMQEQGLERTTSYAIKQFRQHEKIVGAMIAEGAYAPMLAVDCGLLDGLLEAFQSDYPTRKEIAASTKRLSAYCKEDQHEALPHLRWMALREIIDTGCERLDSPAPSRPTASIIDISGRQKSPKPQ